MSNWYRIIICAKCENELSWNEKMYSSGICKHCGYDDHSTVCDTKNVIIKTINPNKWWEFWKPKEYVGKDEFSKNWLKKHKN